MKISKKDALMWFRFFAELPDDEELMPHQQEIALAALAQLKPPSTSVVKRWRRKSTVCKACPGGHISWQQGGFSARMLLLFVGHGAERGTQDEQMQCSMQILL